MSILTLPRATTAKQFFEEILPGELAQVPIPADCGSDRAQFTITGPTGGAWSVGVVGGRADVAAGVALGAPFHVTISDVDARELLLGSVRDRLYAAVGGAAAVEKHYTPKNLTRLFLPAHKVAQIKALRGDIQLEIEDDEEMSSYVLTLTIGGGAPNLLAPATKVKIEVNDWLAIATRKMDTQQAFMAGKLQMQGDIALPMGLMGIFLNP
jgi:hypothetical protein